MKTQGLVTALMGVCLIAQSTAHASSFTDIRDRFRIRTFTEIMGPAFKGNPASVPDPKGDQLDPINAFNIITVDYLIKGNMRLLYLQRIPWMMSTNTLSTGHDLSFWDPRLGLRLVNPFKVEGLSQTLDFYTQIPTSERTSLRAGMGDIGIQTSTSYLLSPKWTIGIITDTRGMFYTEKANGRGSRFSFFAGPWISYNLTPKLSTQHWVWMAGYIGRGDDKSLNWDYPGNPFTQNGLGYSLTDRIWVALFINNYLRGPSIRLESTWTSLWISMSIL